MASKLTDSLRDKFRDLDNNDVYTSVKAQAASDQARNFVVEFNHDEARIASGLSSDEFGVLLGQKAPEGMVRWINIWSPSKQTSVVKQIGNRYGFSPRLQALMVAPNLASALEVDNKQDSKQGDIESVLMHDEPKAQPSTHTTEQSLEDIEIYQLVKETVNYTSIDQGKECEYEQGLCLTQPTDVWQFFASAPTGCTVDPQLVMPKKLRECCRPGTGLGLLSALTVRRQ